MSLPHHFQHLHNILRLLHTIPAVNCNQLFSRRYPLLHFLRRPFSAGNHSEACLPENANGYPLTEWTLSLNIQTHLYNLRR